MTVAQLDQLILFLEKQKLNPEHEANSAPYNEDGWGSPSHYEDQARKFAKGFNRELAKQIKIVKEYRNSLEPYPPEPLKPVRQRKPIDPMAATPKQKRLLREFGVSIPKGLTKAKASEMITANIKLREISLGYPIWFGKEEDLW